jgi:hypothetical protein
MLQANRGLGHMTISELKLKTRDEEPVRRFEVFTGVDCRKNLTHFFISEGPPTPRENVLGQHHKYN